MHGRSAMHVSASSACDMHATMGPLHLGRGRAGTTENSRRSGVSIVLDRYSLDTTLDEMMNGTLRARTAAPPIPRCRCHVNRDHGCFFLFAGSSEACTSHAPSLADVWNDFKIHLPVKRPHDSKSLQRSGQILATTKRELVKMTPESPMARTTIRREPTLEYRSSIPDTRQTLTQYLNYHTYSISLFQSFCPEAAQTYHTAHHVGWRQAHALTWGCIPHR